MSVRTKRTDTNDATGESRWAIGMRGGRWLDSRKVGWVRARALVHHFRDHQFATTMRCADALAGCVNAAAALLDEHVYMYA